jgi:hypothetical protein
MKKKDKSPANQSPQRSGDLRKWASLELKLEVNELLRRLNESPDIRADRSK